MADLQTLTAIEADRDGKICTGVAVTATDARVLWDANLVIIVTNSSAYSTSTLTIEESGRKTSDTGYNDNEGGAVANNGVAKCFGPFTDKIRWCDTTGYLNLTFEHISETILVQCVILPVQKSEADTRN
jgi:hypothetical protein